MPLPDRPDRATLIGVAWVVASVGVVLSVALILLLGALGLPDGDGFARVLAGGTLTTAFVVVGTWALAALGAASTATVVALPAVGAAGAAVAVRRSGVAWWPPGLRTWVSPTTAPVLLVGGAAVALAMVSAWLLPVWQWDALGYHLPFVNLVLQHGTLADVPRDVPYLSTYPHAVEWVFTAWRALLPDDTLVELGHLPFGLLGAVAVAAVAARFGARADVAVAAGAAWLTLPAVFLQLPTNYTDVASAALALTAIAWLLGELDARRIVLAGLTIGLFLASKPQAPPAAVVLLVTLTVLGLAAGHRVPVALAWVLALLGTASHLVNVVRHGNPVWPVQVDLGPLHLPGTTPVAALLDSGGAAPRAHGSLLARVVESWTTLAPPVPAFDMRLGGLGLLFLIALPVAAVRAVRTRSWAVAACVAATLLTPDPAVARYVLPFAGLMLALAAGGVSALRGWRVAAMGVVVSGMAVANLVIAYPGLVGEGPPLSAYPAMTPEQRQRAVGASGPPIDYLDALAELPPGAVTVVDAGAELPYLAWPPDLSHAAVFAPPALDAAGAAELIRRPEVGLLIVGDEGLLGRAARAHPELFEEAFTCRSAPCTGYLRR